MFSHYYEPIGGEEIHKVDYSHIISPYQVIGKDKEIRNLVTNVEQREDLNTQVRKRGEKGCKKRGRQADNKWTNLKKYKRKQRKMRKVKNSEYDIVVCRSYHVFF